MLIPIPILDSTPTAGMKSGCSSGGCSSGCGSSGGHAHQTRVPHVDAESTNTGISFDQRRLNLGATPSKGTFVTYIDLDLTVECNLRCTYCFKEKWNEHMEERVAFDAVLWLLHASGPRKSVTVNFMGGEPLLRFRLIKKLVPFGKRRAAQIGKNIHFGMTTNGTLVTDEVVSFWRKWNMGFHTSIDGTPEVQNLNRPTTSGRGSSHLVEKSVPKVLEYRPQTTARSTVVPATAETLVDSYKYFRSLGYINVAFVPGGPSFWNPETIGAYEKQLLSVCDILINDFREGQFIFLKGIDDAIQGIIRNKRPNHACGAGRGLLLVDIHGDIWPCHRWNKDHHQPWRIGNIYEQFDELVRAELDQPSHTDLLEQNCEICIANKFCAGGCPAENLEETGKVYKRHPNACELTRVWARAGQYVHDVLLKERNATFLDHYYKDGHPEMN